MLTYPAQHKFFLVEIVRLPCAPVEVNRTVDTAFEDVPQHGLQRCKSSPTRDHQHGRLILLVDELSYRPFNAQQGAYRQSLEQLPGEATAGDAADMQLQQLTVMGRT